LIPQSPDSLTPFSGSVHQSAVVGPGVSLGPRCSVGPFCHFEGRVAAGANNVFATGVTVGGAPMDAKYRGEETGVSIGSGNRFFDYATVHRATGAGNTTTIGDRNFVMAYVHIAHNCRIGDGCVITNGAQVAGHVELGDGANVGGLAGIHQFCRIGSLAMIGACTYVSKDVPPFMLAAGNPCRVRGVNAVGLRRAGLGAAEIATLRQAFRLIYRSDLNLGQALERIASELVPAAAGTEERLKQLVAFIRASRRGVELRTGPDSDGKDE
jgi:UDP-N-acetylglucosamine acyltransferase